jgi:hypothetical protein
MAGKLTNLLQLYQALEKLDPFGKLITEKLVSPEQEYQAF